MQSVEFGEGPQPVRDMSRAHWQRGIGNIVFSELAISLMDDNFASITDERILSASYSGSSHALGNARPDGSPPDLDVHLQVWANAFDLSRMLFESPSHTEIITLDPETLSEIRHHTHAGDDYAVLEEGMGSQSVFPINLSMLLAREAKNQGISGFETGSLDQIAKFIDRPDFRDLVDVAASAQNGFWGTYANTISPPGLIPGKFEGVPRTEIEFDFVDGSVYFSQNFRASMRGAIVRNNLMGDSSTEDSVVSRPSSGCPVRHEQPAVSSINRKDALRVLGETFGKKPDELLQKRDESAIQHGITLLSILFKRADKILD